MDRLSLIGALFAGISILVISLMAVLTRLPPPIEAIPAVEVYLSGVVSTRSDELIDPRLLTALIIMLSLGGLTILFFLEVMNPRAGLKVRPKRSDRVALDALEGKGGG